jgi:hypothetical protein
VIENDVAANGMELRLRPMERAAFFSAWAMLKGVCCTYKA